MLMRNAPLRRTVARYVPQCRPPSTWRADHPRAVVEHSSVASVAPDRRLGMIYSAIRRVM
jgi:hypothetical protein